MSVFAAFFLACLFFFPVGGRGAPRSDPRVDHLVERRQSLASRRSTVRRRPLEQELLQVGLGVVLLDPLDLPAGAVREGHPRHPPLLGLVPPDRRSRNLRVSLRPRRSRMPKKLRSIELRQDETPRAPDQDLCPERTNAQVRRPGRYVELRRIELLTSSMPWTI
jgi:hypothetical protein